jgi:hypothetical protein
MKFRLPLKYVNHLMPLLIAFLCFAHFVSFQNGLKVNEKHYQCFRQRPPQATLLELRISRSESTAGDSEQAAISYGESTAKKGTALTCCAVVGPLQGFLRFGQ